LKDNPIKDLEIDLRNLDEMRTLLEAIMQVNGRGMYIDNLHSVKNDIEDKIKSVLYRMHTINLARQQQAGCK